MDSLVSIEIQTDFRAHNSECFVLWEISSKAFSHEMSKRQMPFNLDLDLHIKWEDH